MATANKQFQINNIYLVLGISALILLLSFLGFLDDFEGRTLDYRFLIRGRQPVNKAIEIIEIGDEDITQFGRWPWPRGYYAGFMRILSEYKPRTVIFDILFSEDDAEHPEDDALMAGETSRLGNVYYAMFFSVGNQQLKSSDLYRQLDAQKQQDLHKFSIKDPEYKKLKLLNAADATDATIPVAGLYNVASGVGFANMPAEKDGITRKVPLAIEYNGRLYPSLSLASVCGYLGGRPSDIKITDKFVVIKTSRKYIKIPIDRCGNMIINYAGPFNLFKRSSFYAIAQAYDRIQENPAQNEVILDNLKDKIVMVGITATGSTDLRSTPFSSTYPGIGIHASIINSILQGRFLHKVGWQVRALVILLLGVIISVFIPKRRPIIGAVILLGILLGYIVAAQVLFTYAGVWMDIVAPAGVILFSYTAVVFNQFTAERFQKRLIENELSIASTIQQSLLPKNIPQKKGIRIAARSISAKQVGGDLYDFIDLGSTRLGIMIGDVSGKGVPAAIYMAMTLGEFRSRAALYNQPSKMLGVLNDILTKEGLSNMFVTLLYVILDSSGNQFVFSNGGHNAIFYKEKTSNKIRRLESKEGAPLGVIDGVMFCDEVINFKSGDMFILFTDGINEARNRAKVEFGQERLEKFIIDNKDLEPSELVDGLIDNLKIFSKGAPAHDDMTLIAVKFD